MQIWLTLLVQNRENVVDVLGRDPLARHQELLLVRHEVRVVQQIRALLSDGRTEVIVLARYWGRRDGTARRRIEALTLYR